MADLIAKMVVVATLVAGLVAVTSAGGASASPLPPGGYAADVDGGIVSLWVDADGDVVVSGDHADVRLDYDDAGRVLDVFEVVTEDGTWQVDIDVRDGVYLVTVLPPGDEDATTSDEREIVDEPSDMADRVNGVAELIQRGVDGVQSTAEGVMERARGAVSGDPGRSDEAPSRDDGRTPGNSDVATSRTGVPPGRVDDETGPPAHSNAGGDDRDDEDRDGPDDAPDADDSDADDSDEAESAEDDSDADDSDADDSDDADAPRGNGRSNGNGRNG